MLVYTDLLIYYLFSRSCLFQSDRMCNKCKNISSGGIHRDCTTPCGNLTLITFTSLAQPAASKKSDVSYNQYLRTRE